MSMSMSTGLVQMVLFHSNGQAGYIRASTIDSALLHLSEAERFVPELPLRLLSVPLTSIGHPGQSLGAAREEKSSESPWRALKANPHELIAKSFEGIGAASRANFFVQVQSGEEMPEIMCTLQDQINI